MERRHEARVEGRVIRLSECDRSLNVVDHCHAHLYKYAHRIDQLFGAIGEADESQNNTREPYIRKCDVKCRLWKIDRIFTPNSLYSYRLQILIRRANISFNTFQ